MPPGDLAPDSGTGQTTQVNYAPGMRFPMEAAQAYANSQVYGYGGYLGPAGGQCNDNNYAYAWRDNFCETRGYSTPMCPSFRLPMSESEREEKICSPKNHLVRVMLP